MTTAQIILWICHGAISAPLASDLARQIDRSTIPRELVVAVMYHESRCNPRARSGTSDYGLMQIHVSKSCAPSYRGREHRLFDPRLNLRLAISQMIYWRHYHQRRRRMPIHHWIGHYNQGNIVQDRGYEKSVLKIAERITEKEAAR